MIVQRKRNDVKWLKSFLTLFLSYFSSLQKKKLKTCLTKEEVLEVEDAAEIAAVDVDADVDADADRETVRR